MGLQSAMEALPEALLPEQRASFMEDLSEQHLWAYLLQAFLSYVAIFAFAGAMEPWQHHFFSLKKCGRAKCNHPDPMRLQLRAPGSATPTSTVHAFFRCTRWLSTFHRRARPVFTRPSQSESERDLSSKALSFSKERMRERERASMTGESSRERFKVGNASSQSETCLHNLLPRWSKWARERDLFSTALSSSKERLWEGFNDRREWSTLRGLQWRERVVEKI